MSDVDLDQLAQDAKTLGYASTELVTNRLTRLIIRNESYLKRRNARGTHTSHDDTTAEDCAVLALAIKMLEAGK